MRSKLKVALAVALACLAAACAVFWALFLLDFSDTPIRDVGLLLFGGMALLLACLSFHEARQGLRNAAQDHRG